MRFGFILFVGFAVVGLAREVRAGGVPVVAAPALRQCGVAQVKDLGVWDDFLRFEDRDFILLRKRDAVFSCAIANGEIKPVYQAANLTNAVFVGGVILGKREWVFFDSRTSAPFAVDLASGKTASFEIPRAKVDGEHAVTIGEIVRAGSGPGVIIGISGNGAADWPREENRPLYFWFNEEAGEVKRFSTGWNLDYFSADQKKVVFETISTNAWMYRPWVTVSLADGEVTDEAPDQTKGIWSQQMPGHWSSGNSPWLRPNASGRLWELRSARTPLGLLYPQPGRGHSDDRFAGISVNGAAYPMSIAMKGMDRCAGARAAGGIAAVALQPDGASGNFLWLKKLRESEPAVLLATNCEFELLGERGCVWTALSPAAAMPDAFVYDLKRNEQWKVWDGVSLVSQLSFALSKTNDFERFARGIGPTFSLRLIAGFGSTGHSAKVICSLRYAGIDPDNVTPPPLPAPINLLLTSQGARYEIHLPASLRDVPMSQAWLHNSGKLIVGRDEYSPGGSARWRLYLVDLRVGR